MQILTSITFPLFSSSLFLSLPLSLVTMRKPPGEHMLCVYLAVWLVYLSPCAAQTLSGYTLLDGTYQVKRRRRGEEGV